MAEGNPLRRDGSSLLEILFWRFVFSKRSFEGWREAILREWLDQACLKFFFSALYFQSGALRDGRRQSFENGWIKLA
jgi:hypothetical protein